MPGPTFRRGERVELCPLEREDLEFCVEHLNDPAVRHGLARSTPLSMTEEESWFESQAETDDDTVFAVCRDGDLMGTCGLHGIDRRSGVGELGYWLAPEYHGQGYATDAARAVAGYAFDEQRLAKVYAKAFGFNDASQRVLEKVGFQQEGRLRDHFYIDGERVDVLEFGLFPDELEA